MLASATRVTLRVDPILLAILLGSLVLKLLLAIWAEPLAPRNDEVTYKLMARALEEGRNPGALRPPGYPAFMAGISRLGGDVSTVRIVQACLSVASTLLVYALGHLVGGIPSARLAGGLFAFDPVLVGFSHLLWSETLYVFLWLAGLVLLLDRSDTGTRWRWTTAGGVFGLAAWVRPQILTFLPFVLVWNLWRGRGPALRPACTAVALLFAGCLLVVLPRTVTELVERDRLVVVSSTGAFNLLVGTNPTAAFVDKDDHWKSSWGQLPGGGYEQGAALKISWLRVVSHPGLFVRKAAWEISHLFTLDSFVLRHLRNGWYGDLPQVVLPAAVAVTAGFSAMLIATGLLGLLLQPASPFRALAGLSVLHALLLFGATYSLSRYCVPLRPLLAVACAWLFTHPRVLRAAGLNGPRLALLAAGIAALAFSWWNDAPLVWDMLLEGGRAYRFRWLEE